MTKLKSQGLKYCNAGGSVRPGQLAGNSERARGFFFLLYILISIYFLNMKPLSVEMACLLGIQNLIQAV